MESTPLHATNDMITEEAPASFDDPNSATAFPNSNNNTDFQVSQASSHEDQELKQDSTPSSSNNINDAASHAESETEDEEVKMNCMGGARGMEDSDIYTTDDDELLNAQDEQEDEDEVGLDISTNSTPEEKGIVTFVSGNFTGGLIRPKATSPPRRFTLSPALEEDEEEEADSGTNSDRSSIGARGVALSLGTRTPSAMSEDSDADDEDASSDEEDDENEDLEEKELDLSEESKEQLAKIQAAAARLSDAIDARAALSAPENNSQQVVEGDPEDDTELDSINKTLEEIQNQDDSEHASSNALDHLLGVAKDREDFLTLPKTKRVLSFNTLAMLNAEAGRSVDSPKRLKGCYTEGGSSTPNGPPPMSIPGFCLGPSAWSAESSPPVLRVRTNNMRRESPLVSSSDEDEALEGQLREELEHTSDPEDLVVVMDHASSPVPLLTPPGSPLTIELDGGGTTTLCEWPSNLAVDSALTAAQTRPVEEGPAEGPYPDDLSLQESLTRDLKETCISSNDSQQVKENKNSTLTPLLRGISVTLQ